MPAVSEAQRRLLNARFGHAWVKAHHFDNKGPLPMHVGGKMSLNKALAKQHRRRKAKPNAHAPLGQGGRFAALEQKLAARPGVTNPGALAAFIGRKKFGAKRFNALSRGGR